MNDVCYQILIQYLHKLLSYQNSQVILISLTHSHYLVGFHNSIIIRIYYKMKI